MNKVSRGRMVAAFKFRTGHFLFAASAPAVCVCICMCVRTCLRYPYPATANRLAARLNSAPANKDIRRCIILGASAGPDFPLLVLLYHTYSNTNCLLLGSQLT